MTTITAILPYVQIVLSIVLALLVLVQKSDADLGGAFGGSDTATAASHTRRGLEKTLYNSTIFVAILFVASTFAALIIQ